MNTILRKWVCVPFSGKSLAISIKIRFYINLWFWIPRSLSQRILLRVNKTIHCINNNNYLNTTNIHDICEIASKWWYLFAVMYQDTDDNIMQFYERLIILSLWVYWFVSAKYTFLTLHLPKFLMLHLLKFRDLLTLPTHCAVYDRLPSFWCYCIRYGLCYIDNEISKQCKD